MCCDLLDAFEALSPDHPDATLDFAGCGGGEEELIRRIAASPASGRVRYLGRLTGEEVHNILDETNLLICPTRSTFNEGLALVVVEAAIHGVPSLLSSVVPAKDLVADACVEFPADDTGALRDRLEQILSNPSLYRELRARTAQRREIFTDRSKSWGSELYRALVHWPGQAPW